MPILSKIIIFSNEAHFDLGGYVKKQNCRIWSTENPHAYIEKPAHPKRVTVWWGGVIGPFFFENKQGQPATVYGDRYRTMLNEFLFTKIEEGFNRTQSKLYSMFCALFLKIALSAAELMLFGHLGAAIWHRWTIIYGMSSKISVTLTSLRQLTLSRIILVNPLMKYSCIQSIMCLKIGPSVQATAWPAGAVIWMKLFSIINRKDCTFK